MPSPAFQVFVVRLEASVSEWENVVGGGPIPAIEVDFYTDLRSALDTYYAEVARR